MKILHLTSETGWRGGEQQLAFLLDELKALGVSVFAGARKGSEFERYCKKRGIDHFALPFRNSFDVSTALEVKRICRRLSIDLIHLHTPIAQSVAVIASSLGNSVPMVLSRRVDFVPKKNLITKWKYNHPAIKRVLCVSRFINDIMRGYLKEPDKSVTVYSGVDLQKFANHAGDDVIESRYGIPRNIVRIGNTSALEAHKDYFTFIRTIQLLKKRQIPVHAFIIGKGSLDSKLRQFANELGVDDAITFTGFVSNIVELLPRLDIFLMTSSEEGLGTSILDAFLAGPVVVATAAGGIPEMVVNGETGLLAPVGDETTLASHIESVMRDQGLAARLKSGARKKVEQFSKSATATKTLAVYREVLKEAGGTSH